MQGYFQPYVPTVIGFAEVASDQLNIGSVGQISVKTCEGTIVLIPAGPKAILTVLTEQEAQLGLIFFEMESKAENVDRILRTI